MKKLCFLSILLLLQFSVVGQIITIPDANFKTILLNQADANNDGELDQNEALSITHLGVAGSNISNLTGIEYLTELQDLSFRDNPVTSVNLQNLSHLWRIWCDNTLLTEINLCGTAVTFLWCFDNPNLQSLYLKNGVISPDLALLKQIPPPLHNYEFYNSPLLTFICYDDGEFNAVNHAIAGNSSAYTLTTSCDANCVLSDGAFDFFNITLYPNPARNHVTIDFKKDISVSAISVLNTLGQLVKTIKNAAQDNRVTIDISDLNSGTYFINISSDKGKSIGKFIKM